MELDVGQIDLLDLPLPPRSSPTGAADAAGAEEAATDQVPNEEIRTSKGPPPLPTILTMPPPPEPPPPPASPAISARTLVGESQPEKSPMGRFLIGVGGATALCVAAFFVFRAVHKTPPAAPAATAASSAAPTHAFTMAPIEFTAGSTEPEESAAPSATAAPVRSHPSSSASAAKPPATHPTSTDGVIKVEN
jgi:hypothetical protein